MASRMAAGLPLPRKGFFCENSIDAVGEGPAYGFGCLPRGCRRRGRDDGRKSRRAGGQLLNARLAQPIVGLDRRTSVVWDLAGAAERQNSRPQRARHRSGAVLPADAGHRRGPVHGCLIPVGNEGAVFPDSATAWCEGDIDREIDVGDHRIVLMSVVTPVRIRKSAAGFPASRFRQLSWLGIADVRCDGVLEIFRGDADGAGKGSTQR
jgi:hypothetical protein